MSRGLNFFDGGKLPPGWIDLDLGHIRRTRSITFNPDKEPEGTYELYSVPSHATGMPEVIKASEIGSNKQYVEPGDVLISKINPRINRAWVVGDFSRHKKIASTEWIVFSKNALIQSKLLQYMLTDGRVRDYLSHNASGVGGSLTRVKPSLMDTISIGLPPENEQHRIVAKIEELFSELDKGIESLKTAREQLKVYRQAVLKHAFEGKLTAQWREEKKGKLETADQLLARIQKEREARYQRSIEGWKAAVKAWEKKGKEGKKPPKPRTPKTVLKLPDDMLDVLPGIPECWVWEKLGLMTCSVEYGTATKSSDFGSVPVIRMGNIQNGKIDWNDLVFTSDEAEIEKYSLKPGDILFNRTNSPELVGKSAIYQGERPALFAGYLIRINHIGSAVDGRYLNYFLNSHVAKQYGNSVKTDGVNQSNINGEKLQSYPFPYCTLPEQHEVVRVIEEKLSITDRFLGDIKVQLDRAETLRQSILKKAFSGQLVPQDPNDEPASVLLERIKAEKAKQTPKPHRKRKPRKAASV